MLQNVFAIVLKFYKWQPQYVVNWMELGSFNSLAPGQCKKKNMSKLIVNGNFDMYIKYFPHETW